MSDLEGSQAQAAIESHLEEIGETQASHRTGRGDTPSLRMTVACTHHAHIPASVVVAVASGFDSDGFAWAPPSL